MAINDRIIARMAELKLSRRDVYPRIGVSKAAFSLWISGKGQPRSTNLLELAKVLQCSPEWLQFGSGPLDAAPQQAKQGDSSSQMLGLDASPLGAVSAQFVDVPFYSVEFSAGHGSFACDVEATPYPIASSHLSRLGISAESAFVSRIKGNSMTHTLSDGDVVLFDRSVKQPQSGKIFAFRIDDELRVKRFYREIDGRWRISSDNEDKNRYPDEMADNTLVNSLEIIGQAKAVVEKSL